MTARLADWPLSLEGEFFAMRLCTTRHGCTCTRCYVADDIAAWSPAQTVDYMRAPASRFESLLRALRSPPWVDLDGMIHTRGDECCMPSTLGPCHRCGGRLHSQGSYYGLLLHCEGCDLWNTGTPPPEDA